MGKTPTIVFDIQTEAQLRELIGEPTPTVQSKIASRLNSVTRTYVERSPFVCLATSDRQGRCDVSPRGDQPGFVKILDDSTLLLPERPGNKLADSLRNILDNPNVGLLFFLPGLGDTFRVNGRASLTTEPTLLDSCSAAGKVPKLAIRISIEQAFTHCPKAFLRSSLWDPQHYLPSAEFPSGGQVLKSLYPDFNAETYDRERAERYARGEGLY